MQEANHYNIDNKDKLKEIGLDTRNYKKVCKGVKQMNEYINLTLENIDNEHICCAIGDPKHQAGVDKKKEWIKSKLKEGHVFRKLNARGKNFIE